MTAALTLLRTLWPYALALAIGFAAAWSWQGSRADARVFALESQHKDDLIERANVWIQNLTAARGIMDKIDTEAAARDRQLTQQLKETQHALKTATTGRLCLGSDALSVLDRATGLSTPDDTASAVSGGTAAAATDTALAASDTDVAGWIAITADLYERCRDRLRDIREYVEAVK
ncbi:MAG: hypothetical protein LBE24_10570 [Methylobacillus sp.]|jgi:hypothetical protein|nr:hypothetical protein [Methylobacillus sp.]